MPDDKPSVRVLHLKPAATAGATPAAAPVAATPERNSGVAHRSHDEHEAVGKALRETVPRSASGKWKKPADRVDPIELLEAYDAERLPELVPIRRDGCSPRPSPSIAARLG